MQTVLGNGRRTGSQESVTPGSTVTADDVNFGMRAPQLLFNRLEQIELAGIVRTHIACAMVAQEVVQTRQSARNIRISNLVNDIDALVGMGMEQPQPMFLRRWRSYGCRRGNGCVFRHESVCGWGVE